MKWSSEHPAFNELLQLNPWANKLWRKRLELIKEHCWNVNSVNQGGNTETREWLNAFYKARSDATLAMLRSDSDEYSKWAKAVGTIVARLFEAREFADARPGSKVIMDPAGGYSVNFNERIEEYSLGQLKADILLLSQSSLRSLEIDQALDLSSKVFPVGLDLVGSTFLDTVNAKGAVFGQISDHSSAKFQSADFSQSQFFDQAYFTMSTFDEDVTFANAVFKGPATFSATRFSAKATFKASRFESSTGFCGTLFEKEADFSNAVFVGDTTFEDSVFKVSATFDNASFPGTVYVGRIPNDVRQAILDADHP